MSYPTLPSLCDGHESRFVKMQWFVLVSLSVELLSKEFDAGVYFSRSLTEV